LDLINQYLLIYQYPTHLPISLNIHIHIISVFFLFKLQKINTRHYMFMEDISLYSLKFCATIIDGCILGFGRGSGNAKTKLLLMDLNKNHRYNYDFINEIEYG